MKQDSFQLQKMDPYQDTWVNLPFEEWSSSWEALKGFKNITVTVLTFGLQRWMEQAINEKNAQKVAWILEKEEDLIQEWGWKAACIDFGARQLYWIRYGIVTKDTTLCNDLGIWMLTSQAFQRHWSFQGEQRAQRMIQEAMEWAVETDAWDAGMMLYCLTQNTNQGWSDFAKKWVEGKLKESLKKEELGGELKKRAEWLIEGWSCYQEKKSWSELLKVGDSQNIKKDSNCGGKRL